jgi:dihydrodipicolinate synthase/N-acetylneuraminate lyase
MAPVIGVIPACITCFEPNGEIDYERTRQQVDWIIDAGVHGLIASGTCGEFSTLEIDERRRLTSQFVEWVGGRVPLYVGVMHTSTRTAVELAKYAQAAGAAGVMSVSPYYSSPPERELLGYFRDLAEAVDIPLVVYNNPGASGVSISLHGLAELAHEGTARVIKDSHGDPSRIHDLRLLVPEQTALVYGEDYGSFEAILAGADGWVAGVGNFMPRHAVRLWELARSGELDKAREYWFEILPLINITSHKPMFGRPEERPDFIQVYKAALDKIGFAAGQCRRPLLPLPEEDLAYLHGLMKDLSLARETA